MAGFVELILNIKKTGYMSCDTNDNRTVTNICDIKK